MDVAKLSAVQTKILQARIDEIRDGVNVSCISPEVQNLLKTIIDVPQEAFAEAVILHSLAFADMHWRFDHVDEAHYDTFRWILDGEAAPGKGDGQRPERI